MTSIWRVAAAPIALFCSLWLAHALGWLTEWSQWMIVFVVLTVWVWLGLGKPWTEALFGMGFVVLFLMAWGQITLTVKLIDNVKVRFQIETHTVSLAIHALEERVDALIPLVHKLRAPTSGESISR